MCGWASAPAPAFAGVTFLRWGDVPLKPVSDETGECGVSFFEWSVGSLADGPYISESIFSAIEMSMKKTILKFV